MNDTMKKLDQLCIDTIRTLAMDAVQQANSGHPGTAMAERGRRALRIHLGRDVNAGLRALKRAIDQALR